MLNKYYCTHADKFMGDLKISHLFRLKSRKWPENDSCALIAVYTGSIVSVYLASGEAGRWAS